MFNCIRKMEDKCESEADLVQQLRQNVDEIVLNIDMLEQRTNEIQRFYSSKNKKHPNVSKASMKKRQQDTSCVKPDAAKRMQDLMHQFAEILHHHITGHKWAGPFLQPVDVVGLGLHDYYEVIEKPMDFSTIKNKMKATDGRGYKNVREICADVRLVFKNAMKYNDERNDVHVMSKTLLAKFEGKWLQLLPKVIEEDERRKREEAEAKLDVQLALEVDHAKMARELSVELNEVDLRLEKLREVVLQNSRKMSMEDKKTPMKILTQLSPEDLDTALLIVAQNDPNFKATCKEVDLDMDAQSESILWKLKLFVKDIYEKKKKNINEYNRMKRKKRDL